jgi:hypothetical protein
LAIHPKTKDLALASFLPLEKANTSEELGQKLNLRIETFFETKLPELSSFRAANREAILNLGGGVLSAFEWVKSKLD